MPADRQNIRIINDGVRILTGSSDIYESNVDVRTFPATLEIAVSAHAHYMPETLYY